jgi:hypothetical protein
VSEGVEDGLSPGGTIRLCPNRGDDVDELRLASDLYPIDVFQQCAIAALIVIPLVQGWSGLRELGLRMIRWRVR